MSLLKLKNLSKTFTLDEDLTFQALKKINLEIKQGEFVAITGPSGSGKSTLMNIIGLLDRPSEGVYEIDGHNVSQLHDNTLAELRNKKIGFIFQSFNLLPRTSALDNVAMPLIYSGIDRPTREEKALLELRKVGLGTKIKSHPNQLSGGQQQRIAVARALVTDPQILLADEPTGNLDSKTGIEILNLFKELHANGRTIILITHDLNIAKQAKRIIRVKDGRIL